MITKSLGMLLMLEAACMLPSLGVAILFGQGDAAAFAVSIAIPALIGALGLLVKQKPGDLYARDGFALVGMGWILVSFVGALPYVLSGAIPSIPDALFESMSGFSTTGASILSEVESLPKGIMFWRNFTNWLGGLGVLVLLIAVLPAKASSIHIMQAESPGPYVDKFVPKIGRVAKMLYIIYSVMTLIQALLLMAGGMPAFDAALHAFGTASTGGFSNRNLSVAAYNSPYIENVITVFMILFGVNLSLYNLLLKGKFKAVWQDEELRFYLLSLSAAIILIAANLAVSSGMNVLESLRYSAFQVGSVTTTTGFSTADINAWPVFSKCILMLMMFMGGCAGSTAGGIKCMRILLMLKGVGIEIWKIIHPKAVNVLKLNGKPVEEDIHIGILTYFFLYIFIFAASTLAVSLDGQDLVTSATASLATLSNIGPGLGLVGPAGNYALFSDFSTVVLTINMLLGRLEIYPVILCIPAFWRRNRI
jgi:trk system potassium uptake protein TrkH